MHAYAKTALLSECYCAIAIHKALPLQSVVSHQMAKSYLKLDVADRCRRKAPNDTQTPDAITE